MKNKYQTLLDDQGKDFLNRMENATIRMQRLINDLFNYSRVTIKAQPFIPVNLSQIMKDILSDLAILIENKKAQIKIVKLPVIEADPVQMHQLFQNLITNAIKFCRTNTIPKIKINNEIKLHRGQESCVITVEDNGIGIEEEYYKKIFEIFQRLSNSSDYEGTGIGLAICKKVVERHHGSISVESIPEKGTRFIVTLPVKQKKEY